MNDVNDLQSTLQRKEECFQVAPPNPININKVKNVSYINKTPGGN